MMPDDGGYSPDFVSKIPRNLWTMPRLDKDVDALAWSRYVEEFYEELIIELKERTAE